MKPSKRQIRVCAPEWVEALRQHISKQPRGYQAQMARETGCSESMINRIKDGKVGSSEWTAVLAVYTGLPIPPLVVDPEQSEMLEMLNQLSDKDRTMVKMMIQGYLDMGKTPTNSNR